MSQVQGRSMGGRRQRAAGALVAVALLAVSVSPASAAGRDTDPEPRALSEPSVPRDELGLPNVDPVDGAPAAAERVLVRFRPGTRADVRRDSLADAGGEQVRTVGSTGFVSVEPTEGTVADVAEALAEDADVAEVQLDHVRSALGWEEWVEEPLVEAAWPYLDLARLPAAWEQEDGSGVTIAVVDGAVRTDDPELAGRVVDVHDVVTGPTTGAGRAHGTLVAGVAAGGANGAGSLGAAYGASVMAVRVLDENGFGTDADIAAGIDWASSKGADVINLSLGGPDPAPVIRAALVDAVARGSVVVVAAGNSADDELQYPAAYAADVPGVLSVSAVDDDGRLMTADAVFPGSSWNDAVSLAAPGKEILGPTGETDGTGSGTSFSAALVSGAAALVVAQHPAWTPLKVADQLSRTARDAGPRGIDPFYGHGILDAGAALGLQPALPLDRPATDGARTDDLPDRATPVTVPFSEQVDLSAEGDVDWYVIDSVAGTDYGISAQGWPSPTITVLDRDGRQLLFTREIVGRYRSVLGGPLYVGVSILGGRTSDWSRPTLLISRAVDQRVPDYVRFESGSAVHHGSKGGRYPVVADVTGDGIADVVSRRSGLTVDGSGLVVTPGDTAGTFASDVLLPIALPAHDAGLAVADLTGDGIPEIVFGDADRVRVVSAAGGTWTTPVTVTGVFDQVRGVTTTDLDLDGDIDVVVARQGNGGGLVVLRNGGTGTLVQEPTLPMSVTGVIAVDMDGGGRPDLLFPNGATLLQKADGSFVAGPVVPGLDGGSLQLQRVDADAVLDLVVVGSSRTTVAYGRAGGGFSPPVDGRVYSSSWPTIGDIDGDGRGDVVSATQFAIQAPDGTFGAAQNLPHVGQYDEWVVVRNVSGDARADVVGSFAVGTYVFTQIDDDPPPGEARWVWGVTPADHASGTAVRPDIQVTAGRDLAAGSVTRSSVRLVDEGGRDVDVTVTVSGRTVSVRPTADLAAGHHYALRVTGWRDTTGAVMHETVRSWFTVAAGGDRYTPLEPVRVMDTREDDGPVTPGTVRSLSLADHVPDGATAVVLNVTAVHPSGLGFVRVYPSRWGVPPPPTSNLNLTPGVDQPNLVTVRLGDAATVDFSTGGSSADLVADLAGYYTAGGATAYVPVEPVRVMDMRTGTGGVPSTPLAAGHWVDLVVAGRAGVPADASAVVLNVTGVAPSRGTNVRVYPTPEAYYDDTPPMVSNLNLSPGRDQPNLVTVRVGDGGRVRFYTQSATVPLIADLAGYYTPTGGAGFHPTAPVRLADTRSGLGMPGGRLVAGATRSLTVAGAGGVPSDAVAAALNVTAVSPSAVSNVRVFPARPGAVPLVSNLNVVPGRDEPNMVVARIGDGGAVSVFNQSGALDLVVDANGWFRTFG